MLAIFEETFSSNKLLGHQTYLINEQSNALANKLAIFEEKFSSNKLLGHQTYLINEQSNVLANMLAIFEESLAVTSYLVTTHISSMK